MGKGVPMWAKGLIVSALGSIAYALLQAAEASRQDYELSVCATNITGVDMCLFNSASNNIIPEGAIAVASMGAAAIAANAFAPPTFTNMRSAFTAYHVGMVAVWYFFSCAWTIVPLVYTSYLLASQASHSGQNLYTSEPATMDTSMQLESLAGDFPYNPCNPNNIYCLSITPGLLAGFGYLFAGATAFWVAWLVMDDTANRVLDGCFVEDEGMDGAYFNAAPSLETTAAAFEAPTDVPHMSQVR